MENNLVKKDNHSLVNSNSGGLGIEGVEGFDVTDLSMPFVKLVHPTSKNIELTNGKKAQAGQWFHTLKKEAKDSMNVVFFYAKKIKTTDPRDETVILDGVRVMAVDLDDMESPFAMQFVKGGYWAYKKLLSAMSSWKVKSIWERSVVLDSKTVKSGQGDEFLVPTMDLSDELNADQKEVVALFAERFGHSIDDIKVEDEEDSAVETDVKEVVTDELIEEISKGIEEDSLEDEKHAGKRK